MSTRSPRSGFVRSSARRLPSCRAPSRRPWRPKTVETPRLLLVTERHRTGGRPLLGVVEEALRANLPAVQFRDRDLPEEEAWEYAAALREATRRRGALLFVNGRPELARAVRADGLHLPEGYPRPPTTEWSGVLTVAAHDGHGLERARQVHADFALLSPLFDTRSHPDTEPLGPKRFAALAAESPVPLVALGGINAGNAHLARESGARGVACMDAILGAPDIAGAVSDLLAAFGD
ncbi:thiamine phosphate synthase [Thiohalorhabdus methylotrophus]|uniref:Thiamine phosphate synthase n=1 Tax=Thiohalorhabdus methylotrophus TaxID=3242694 RepID=A0ABV4TVY3_9GAMM